MIETDEEIHQQKIAKVLQEKLVTNQQWQDYVKDHLEPLLEMEKGKLCQEEEKDDSANNIFDDDFIRSDFGVGTQGSNDDGFAFGKDEEDEEDQKKFY